MESFEPDDSFMGLTSGPEGYALRAQRLVLRLRLRRGLDDERHRARRLHAERVLHLELMRYVRARVGVPYRRPSCRSKRMPRGSGPRLILQTAGCDAAGRLEPYLVEAARRAGLSR